MPALDDLDAAAIKNGLAAQGENIQVEAVARCASTNSELLSRAAVPMPVLLLADEQTAGRGRRGRRWHAAPGAALMFSLRWEFAADAARLGGLSLAVGVAIGRTLREMGADGIRLKWPNDLLASVGKDKAKLGGILIETRSARERVAAVIGVGLNVRRTEGLSTRLKRSVASLDECIGALPARNDIAVRIVAALLRTLREFGGAGFQPFKADWEAMHANQGESMRIRMAGGKVLAGIADGVAVDGGLLLRTRNGVQCIHSGTVVRESALRAPAP
jgi:BirA family biotin operon repressor/biotin-[acetyl-CoA-carboxylase] ligase